MPVDTAPEAVTAAVPALSSGAEAITVAREFAASIAEGAIERDRSAAVPARELAALDASGLLGITVPRAYGGADLPAAVLAEVVRVIAAVDPAIAQVPQSHFLLVDVLAILGTPSQRHRIFGDVLAGARLGGGLAERGGQHAQDLRTRLSGGGTSMRLSGRKYYSRRRSSSARAPSWCMPRSRSGSQAARCGTPASSSGPWRARFSRRHGPAGRRLRARTRTRSTGTASWPPRSRRLRHC